jgi:hypothetical protein
MAGVEAGQRNVVANRRAIQLGGNRATRHGDGNGAGKQGATAKSVSEGKV